MIIDWDEFWNSYFGWIARLISPVVRLYDKNAKAGLLETLVIGVFGVPLLFVLIGMLFFSFFQYLLIAWFVFVIVIMTLLLWPRKPPTK